MNSIVGAIRTAICPSLCTVVGGAVGALVGGCLGSKLGRAALELVCNKFEEPLANAPPPPPDMERGC